MTEQNKISPPIIISLIIPISLSTIWYFVNGTSFPKPSLILLAIALLAISIAFFKNKKQNNSKWIEQSTNSPEFILEELKRSLVDDGKDAAASMEGKLLISKRCLSALFTKWNKSQSQKGKDDIITTTGGELDSKFVLICLEASFLSMRTLPENDEVLSLSIYLLALIARHPVIKNRCKNQLPAYGVQFPIEVMRNSLKRAKSVKAPVEEEEQCSAEIQRRACLFLGALADSDQKLSQLIADANGIDAILDALDWYRYHEQVCSWALWALFCLCYDHSVNKSIIRKKGGITRVCQAMKYIPQSLEVQRHSMAILFDLLRYIDDEGVDLAKVRIGALNAGLHQVVKNAMLNFPKSQEIMLMGKEMLIATGYTGYIPE